MKNFILIVLLSSIFAFSSCVDDSDEKEWIKFKTKFNKTYTDVNDEKLHKNNFIKNLKVIKAHNEKYKLGEVDYKLGINIFSDLSKSEFSKGWLFQVDNDTVTEYGPTATIRINGKLPDEVNYLNEGWLTRVHQQTSYCGSCYTFSAIGAIEAQYYHKYKKYIGLSQQELVDCTKMYGNFGCFGGITGRVFEYIKHYGVGFYNMNPYLAHESYCIQSNPRIHIKSYYRIPFGNEYELQKALYKYGPITVDIDASHPSFQYYVKGVYYQPGCMKNYPNHSVLVVGYGTSRKGVKYWLIKNSWGPYWGDKGYMYMIRGNNHCGIANRAYFPIIE